MMLDQPVILVVDDQVSDLRILGEALEGLGEVHVATDGAAALELARQCRPDIVLLDIEMPNMDGYSVCEHLKSDPRLAHAAVIFVTSHRQTEHELRGLKLGGADFLHKPINLPITRARIQAHLKHGHEMRQLAYFDPLTRLPNRMLLLNRVQQAVHNARDHGSLVGLLSVDMDNFKALNDAEGHAVGDALLQEVARRLEQCCSPSDTASRAGGQRFVLLALSCQSLEDLARCAQAILAAIGEPIVIDGVRYDLFPNVGISVYPEDSSNVESLHEHADAAVYQARQAGRGQYRFFNASMNERSRASHQLERRLRIAVETHQLRVYYQAKVNAAERRVIGAEALVRWPLPEGGMVWPDQFIPLAETSGLIVPLGEFVLNSACDALKAWHEQGHDIGVSVNISPAQFRDPGFLDMIRRAIARSGVSARHLELEITEGVLASDVEQTTQILQQIRALGLGISIDDFGTGYSSLTYLKRYPLDVLKIDQSFVREMLTHDSDAAIVEAIIKLARAFNLQLVAEGVETIEHAQALLDQGCEVMQGYLYCRPVPLEQMNQYLRDNQDGIPGP